MSACVNRNLPEYEKLWNEYKERTANPVNQTIFDGVVGSLMESTNKDKLPAIQQVIEALPIVPTTAGLISKHNLPGKDSQFTASALNAFHYFFFKSLYEQGDKLKQLFDKNNQQNHKLYEQIVLETYSYFAAKAEATLEQLQEAEGDLQQTYNNVFQNYMYLLDYNTLEDGSVQILEYDSINDIKSESFRKLFEIHRMYMRQFGIHGSIKVQSQEGLSEVLDESEIDARDSADLWHIEHLKFSFKDTATQSTKLLFQGLANKKNIKGTDVSSINYDFNLFNPVEPGKLFAIIGNEVANTSNPDLIIQKINQAKNYIAGANELANRLTEQGVTPATMTPAQLLQYLDFLQAFSKHKNQYSFVNVSENGEYNFVDAIVNTQSKRLTASWFSNSLGLRGSRWYTVANNTVVYNTNAFVNAFTENGKAVIASKIAMLNESDFTTEQVTILDSIRNNNAEYRKYFTYFQYTNTLEKIFGINVNTNNLPKYSKLFYKAVESLIFMNLPNKDGVANIVNHLSPNTNATNYLKPIIEQALNNTENEVDNNFLNSTGETQYSLQLNSYLSLLEDGFNEATDKADMIAKYPHLSSTYANDGLILNDYLFDEAGNRQAELKMIMLDSLNGDKNTPFSKLEMVDKTGLFLSMSIAGRHPFFRAGDNSIQRYYEGYDFEKKYNREFLANQLTSYLRSELGFFRELQDSFLPKYHRKRGLPIVPTFNDSYFAEILTQQGLESEYTTLLNNNETPSATFIAKFKAGLGEYYRTKSRDLLQFVVDMNLVSKVGDEYINKGLTGISKDAPIKWNESSLLKVLEKAIINNSFWNIEQSKLFTGHPILYADADNFYKRMSMLVGTKNKTLATPDILRGLQQSYQRKTIKRNYRVGNDVVNKIPKHDNFELVYKIGIWQDVVTTADRISELEAQGIANLKAYKDFDESDAIGVVHLDTYRDMFLTNSMWSDRFEALYEWVNRGNAESITVIIDSEVVTIRNRNEITNTDGSIVMFPMAKPQAFGITNDSRFITDGYKLSVIPILPTQAKEFSHMNSMLEYMNTNNIDIVTFPTANKIGTVIPEGGLPKLYDNKLLNLNASIQYSSAKYWGIQLDTGNTSKADKGITGTQIKKIAPQNMFVYGKPKSAEHEAAYTNFININKALVDMEAKKIQEVLGIENLDVATQQQVGHLQKMLLDEILSRNPTNSAIEAMELMPDYLQYGFGLDVLPNKQKLEQIIMALANNRVIRNPVRGIMAVQAPQTLWQNDVLVYADEAVKEMGDKLRFFPETSTMQIRIPHRFKEFYGSNLSINDIPKELLRTIGYRIPTSGKNSIERLEIVGFIDDSYGDIVILPSEIVAKAGSDFDVDKLNIFLPHYMVEYPKGVEFIFNKFPKDTFKQTAQNIAENFMKDPEYAEGIGTWNSLEKETYAAEQDNFYYELKSYIATEFRKNESEISKEYFEKYGNVSSKIKYIKPSMKHKKGLENAFILALDRLMELTSRKEHNEPIGISLFEQAEARIVPKLPDAMGKGTFSQLVFDMKYQSLVTERNMTSKSLVGVEALLTTDISTAQRYNLAFNNEFELYFEEGTYNTNEDGLVSLAGESSAIDPTLISEMFNQSTNAAVDGAKNPIFFNLNFNFVTAPIINMLLHSGVEFQNVMTFINQPIVRRYAQLESYRKSETNKLNGNLFNFEAMKAQLDLEFGFKPQLETVTWEQMENELGKTGFSEVQAKILLDLLDYKTMSEAYQDYLKATRTDTELSKNTSALDLKLARVEKVIKDNKIINISDVFNAEDSYVATYHNALKTIRGSLDGLFLHYMDSAKEDSTVSKSGLATAHDQMLDYILNDDKYKFTPEKDLIAILDKLKLDYLSAVMITNPIKIYDDSNYGIISDKVFELLSGKNSVSRRLDYAKKAYPDNLLVRELHAGKGENQYTIQGKTVFIDNIKLFDQRIPVEEQNSIVDAWRELFSLDTQLAKDLVAVTLLQSGLKKSPLTFTQFIPPEIYMEMFRNVFDGGAINTPSPNHFLMNFYINNFRDNNLVPNGVLRTDRQTGMTYMTAPNNGFIYKNFPVKKEYQNLSKEQKKALAETKINIYENTPDIFVNAKNATLNPFAEHASVRSVGWSKVDLQNVYDMRNSQSLLAYANPVILRKYNSSQLNDKQFRAELTKLKEQIKDSHPLTQKETMLCQL